jgi:DNA-binding transcriptional regulator YiaG
MAEYKDPNEIRMENGRTMADYIRGGPRGLRGVIVGKATPGGTPVNFDPHDMSKTKINIVDQNGATLRDFTMDQMTRDRVSGALNAANAAIPGDDIESIRERAAMVFEEIAKSANSSVQRVPAKSVAKRAAVQQAAEEEPQEEQDIIEELETEVKQLPIEKVDRTYSPMAAFGMKKKQALPPAAGSSAGTVGRSGPPQKLVYFEKEGIGTVPAFFHDVLVSVLPIDDDDRFEESGFMVLVYDLRFEQNAARWFPPSNDPYGRPWAVKINDDNRLYLVHTTGFQYVYDNREYCVLSVERAVIAVGE